MKFTMLNKNNAKTIASVYGFRIDVTWAEKRERCCRLSLQFKETGE